MKSLIFTMLLGLFLFIQAPEPAFAFDIDQSEITQHGEVEAVNFVAVDAAISFDADVSPPEFAVYSYSELILPVTVALNYREADYPRIHMHYAVIAKPVTKQKINYPLLC